MPLLEMKSSSSLLTLLSFSALQTAMAPSSLRLLAPNLCKDQGRHSVSVGYMLKFEFWANLLNFGQRGISSERWRKCFSATRT